MAEWLYEAGIGENRAILVDNGQIVEARIEWPGLRVGTVADARLTDILIPGKRGIATLPTGDEVLVEPLDKMTLGRVFRIEVTREAIPEPGAVKRAKGRITDAMPCQGPDLAAQIGTHCVINVRGTDEFENAGWSELLEQAGSGIVPFDGGTIRISLTPAMTLIDIDGQLPSVALAKAGATAAARAIRRFGISGNIGIDLPTVAGKSDRAVIDALFERELPRPFERTAMNGFGFVQIVRPRLRASLLEMMQYERADAAARALVRRAQRAGVVGMCEITAHPETINVIKNKPEWLDAIAGQNGGSVSLTSNAAFSLNAGSIHRIS